MTAASDTSVSLADAVALAIENSLAATYVAMPATVQAYYADEQSADLRPAIGRVLRDSDGGRHLEELPVLPHVPVLFPRGGGFFCSWQLSKGDAVLVVVCDRHPGEWIDGGGSDPVDDRVHALSGAVCFPVSFKPSAEAPHDHLAMGAEGGKQVHIKAGEVALGSEAAADYVALASKVDGELTKISTTLSSLTGQAAFGVSYTKAPVGSSIVKAE